MPGGSGIQVFKPVKKWAEVPVIIILTAFPNRQYRHKCQEAGADYFFDKATEFDAVQVLDRLQAATAIDPACGHTGSVTGKKSTWHAHPAVPRAYPAICGACSSAGIAAGA
jgi:DNA-binding NarL/FixJ family response regulator